MYRKKKKGKVHLPFIQFFWGWKWKAVLCQENIASVQSYEFDLGETPWATSLAKSWVWFMMISASIDIRNTMEPNVTKIRYDVFWLLFSNGVCRVLEILGFIFRVCCDVIWVWGLQCCSNKKDGVLGMVSVWMLDWNGGSKI